MSARFQVCLTLWFYICMVQSKSILTSETTKGEEGIDDDLTPPAQMVPNSNSFPKLETQPVVGSTDWVEKAGLEKANSHEAVVARLKQIAAENGWGKQSRSTSNSDSIASSLRDGLREIRQKEAQDKRSTHHTDHRKSKISKAGQNVPGEGSASIFRQISPDNIPADKIVVDLPSKVKSRRHSIVDKIKSALHNNKGKKTSDEGNSEGAAATEEEPTPFVSSFLSSLFGDTKKVKKPKVVKKDTDNNTLVIDLPKMAGNLVQLYTQKEIDFFFDLSPGEVRIAAFFVPQDHYDDQDETNEEREKERSEFRKTLTSLMMTAVDQRWVFQAPKWSEPSTLFLQHLKKQALQGKKFPFAFVQSRNLAVQNGCPPKGWGHYCIAIIVKNIDGIGTGIANRGFSTSPTQQDLQEEIANLIVRENQKW